MTQVEIKGGTDSNLDKKEEISKKNKVAGALLGFFLPPIGYIYVKKYWLAFFNFFTINWFYFGFILTPIHIYLIIDQAEKNIHHRNKKQDNYWKQIKHNIDCPNCSSSSTVESRPSGAYLKCQDCYRVFKGSKKIGIDLRGPDKNSPIKKDSISKKLSNLLKRKDPEKFSVKRNREILKDNIKSLPKLMEFESKREKLLNRLNKELEDTEKKEKVLVNIKKDYEELKKQINTRKVFLDKLNPDNFPLSIQKIWSKYKEKKNPEAKKELIFTLKKELKSLTDDLIMKFIEKFGEGNAEQHKKLKKTLKQKGYDIPMDSLREKIKEKLSELEKKAIKETIEEHSPQTYDEYLEAFVEEFGRGNDEQISYFVEILDKNKYKVDNDLEDKFESMKEQRELNRFMEELEFSESSFSESKDIYDKVLSEMEENEIDWGEIEELNGFEFEYLLKDLFEEKGYDAEVTSGSGDQGCDVVAKKPFEKIVIQAKRYRGKVSNSAVQEIVAAKKYYDAEKAIVITNTGFTESAKELAQTNDVKLWNGNKLKKEIDTYINKKI